jgi:membrane-bound lytic murein transglycosylase D
LSNFLGRPGVWNTVVRGHTTSLTCRFGSAFALAMTLMISGCASLAPPAPGPTTAPVMTGETTPSQNSLPGAQARQAPAGPGATTSTPGPALPPAASAQLPGATVSQAANAGAQAQALRFEGNLWDRIRAGFAFPELNSPLVAEKERFYLQKPEYLQRMFARGGRYLFFIVEEIERRGLPMELALLPFVESAMNPVAMSHASASGLWQFIPSTGKQYNLSQNWWVDNRRDVTRSTMAALDYLQKIHAMQGNDWFLALASYNWGEGSVLRAVKKAKGKGLSGDYLSLDMPAETRHYVPKLIALKNIVMRAQSLGVTIPELANKPYFVTVEKTRPIDLKLAAQFAGMSVEEFIALNPAHNRPVIAASKNNELKIPADRVDGFMKAIDRHGETNKSLTTWQPYTLQTGESLESVAKREGIGLAEIEKANSLKSGARLLPGTRILAPHRSGPVDEAKVESFVAPRVYERVDSPAVYHTVGQRENLQSIAGRYGVSAAAIKAWNGVKKGVGKGMRLMVRPAQSQTLLTNEQGQRSVVSSQAQALQVAQIETGAREVPAVSTRSATTKPSASVRATSPQARKSSSTSGRSAAKRSDPVARPRTKTATEPRKSRRA